MGTGFSVDDQRVTTDVCFNATVTYKTKQVTPVKLSKSVSFSELEKAIIPKDIYKFNKHDILASSRRHIETNRTFPLFFYASYVNEVKLRIKGYGLEALNDLGNNTYSDPDLKRFFGLRCGDYYVTSYTEGGILIFKVLINFNSQYEKEAFQRTFGPNYGSILEAYEKVHTIFVKNGTTGSIVFGVTQSGGETTKHYEIFKDDVICHVTASEKCFKEAHKILNYANVDFAEQVRDEHKLNHLYATGIEPIQKIGLTPPPSLNGTIYHLYN